MKPKSLPVNPFAITADPNEIPPGVGVNGVPEVEVDSDPMDDDYPYTCPRCGPVGYDESEFMPYPGTEEQGDITCTRCGHWLETCNYE